MGTYLPTVPVSLPCNNSSFRRLKKVTADFIPSKAIRSLHSEGETVLSHHIQTRERKPMYPEWLKYGAILFFAGALVLTVAGALLVWLSSVIPGAVKFVVWAVGYLVVGCLWLIGWPIPFFIQGVKNLGSNWEQAIRMFWAALWRCAVILFGPFLILVIVGGLNSGFKNVLISFAWQVNAAWMPIYTILIVTLALAQLIYWLIRRKKMPRVKPKGEKLYPWHPYIWGRMLQLVDLDRYD